MSLTSFVKRPRVRGALKECARGFGLEAGHALLVPPPAENAALVGTAFDYLFRFRVARAAGLRHGPDDWLASRGLAAIERVRGKRRRLYRLALAGHERAIAAVEAYHRLGRVSAPLLRGALHLADLDRCARAGPERLAEGQLERDYAEEVANLRALVGVIPDGCCEPAERCVLNPTFGDASRLVGGADADLIVDDTLVDIKTYREPRVTGDVLGQLVGYYTLLALGGEAGGAAFDHARIRRFGVYFSRHGVLAEAPVGEILTPDALPRLARLFVEEAAAADGVPPWDYFAELAYPGCREWWLERPGHTPEGWRQLREDRDRFPIDPSLHLSRRVDARRAARAALERGREAVAKLEALAELAGGVRAAAGELGMSAPALRRCLGRPLAPGRDPLPDTEVLESFRSLPRRRRDQVRRLLRGRHESEPALY